MTHYTATAAREGRWWMVRIPEVDGLTQARRLGDAETAAREFIAAALDVPLDDVEVTVRVAEVNGVDVDAAVHKISDARYRASVLEREASEAAVTLAKRLAAAEIPMRDIGAIMGVSHQRAAQLASA